MNDCKIKTIAKDEFKGIIFELKEYTENKSLLEITATDANGVEIGRIAFDENGEPEHFSGVCWETIDNELSIFIDGVFNAEIETWKANKKGVAQ